MRTFLLWPAALLLLAGTMHAADWRPIDPAELAQKTPLVEPGADAEAILWDVRIEDTVQGGDLSLTLSHYIRIKIYTDLGREKYATVEIPRYGKRNIYDVAARTIKADGTTIDLKKDAIFDRQLVKTKGVKVQGKTFTLPSVRPGDIIEYRYRESRGNELANYMRLYFQRDLPMWTVTYHLKPLSIPGFPFGMRTMAFQCKHPPFEKEPNGFYATTMHNMPAFVEEPDSPPEDTLRAWMLVYYEEDKKIDAEKFWKETGKSDYTRFKPLTSPDSQVKRTSAELISGIAKPEDQLAALDKFCRTKIRNIYSQANPMTAEERKAIKENRSPGSTLKQMAGTGTDIDLLFTSLAIAAGFEARMARVVDRSDYFLDKGFASTYFMNTHSVAVKVNDKWTFYDPATPYLEPGMLRWQEEGGAGLVSDPKEGFFANTQSSAPARSKRIHRGNFKLLDDGTLEGTVAYVFTGHLGVMEKNRYDDMTPAQREEDFKDSVKNRLSTAEISKFEMTGADSPDKPISVKFFISVPGYGTRTGKRLLFQPAFFQRNFAPRFTATNRKWNVYFTYAWAEEDEVTIELPDGWELDQPVSPALLKMEPVGGYHAVLAKTADARTLVYKRNFDFGRENKLLFPPGAYSLLKGAFDAIQEQDGHMVALKAAANAQ